MKEITLKNGLNVLYEQKKRNAVVVQIMIKTGSNHEAPEERGISHFLEHILFEGTTKRPTNQQISNEIESIGGDFNAYTTNERTCFYIKVLNKHFSKAIDILSDIMLNSLFKEEHIKKEKNIVLKEIDMVNDEPSYFQWLLLQNNIFKKHPARFPTYGDRKIIKNLTRKMVTDYFHKHYVAGNMVISIVGDVKNWKKEVEVFSNIPKGSGNTLPKGNEPLAKRNEVYKKKKKNINTYTLMGFKTVPRTHKDSYTLEVINGILGRGQSGRMFTQIRGKRALAYEVGTQHISEAGFGYFAVYATIDRKNVPLVKKLVLEEIKKVKNITAKDLKESKDFIEGNYLLSMEDVQKVADQLLFWDQIGHANGMKNFVSEIKKVTINDVKRVATKYFNYYTMAIVEGK
ncbi:insulinase family protein [Candidatus Woesearchaeota archaeon]|nr:insulinase family protein [Candidatus Woesearchaeota archaeon]